MRASNGAVMKLHFIRIQMDYPPEMSAADKASPSLRKGSSQCPSTLGYRHMCYFNSFQAIPLLQQHGYADYDYIMRLDDDSHISSPVGYDIFRLMQANKKKYGFVKVMNDDPRCVKGLWAFAYEFLEGALSQGLITQQQYQAAFNTSSVERVLALLPHPAIFYNNFEIAHRSVWEGPVWEAWKAAVTASKGVYSRRWGDAPIHTIAVGMMLSKDELHAFKDLPYRHLPFIDQVSQGLPRPHQDPFLQNLGCYYYDHWVCHNGTETTSLSGLLPLPQWDQRMGALAVTTVTALVSSDASSDISATNGAKASAASKSTALNDALTKLYTTEARSKLGAEADSSGTITNSQTTSLATSVVSAPIIAESLQDRLKRQSGELSSDDAGVALAAIASTVVLPGRPVPIRINKNAGLVNPSAAATTTATNPAQGVLYSYTYAGFEEVVARTVSSFYKNFASMHDVPIVLFYTQGLGFEPLKMRAALDKLLSAQPGGKPLYKYPISLKFIEAPMNPLSRNGKSTDDGMCVADTPEGRSASAYLRDIAPAALAELGYAYYWRFAMDSELSSIVKRDVFLQMRNRGRVYGFRGIIRENPGCIQGAWDLAKSICSGVSLTGSTPRVPNEATTDNEDELVLTSRSSASKAKSVAVSTDLSQKKKKNPNIHCSDLLFKWEMGSVFFTSFEISSRSLYDAIVMKQLLSVLKAREAEAGMLLYGDALVHSLGALMSQPREAVETLNDIPYKSFGAFGYIHLAPVQGSITSSNSNNHAVAAPSKEVYQPPLVLPPPVPLPTIDPFFEPRLFGWLGGDVGVSFHLPDIKMHDASSNVDSKSVTQRYIWLFGDTLVGTSTPLRRLEATMISNSIGVATMAPLNAESESSDRKDSKFQSKIDESLRTSRNKMPPLHAQWSQIQAMNYYWKSTSLGAPTAVLAASRAVYYKELPPPPAVVTVSLSNVATEAERQAREKNAKLVLSAEEAVAAILELQPKFWPFGGLSLRVPANSGSSSTTSDIVVAIIGKLVQPVSPLTRRSELLQDAETGLAFQDLGSALFLVKNPHSPPDQWDYSMSMLSVHPTSTILGAISGLKIFGTLYADLDEEDIDENVGTTSAATPVADAQSGSILWTTIVATAPTAKWVYLTGIYRRKDNQGGYKRAAFDMFGSMSSKLERMIIGRIPATALLLHDKTELELLQALPATGSGSEIAQWTVLSKASSPEAALPYKICASAPESSLHYDAGIQRWILISLSPLTNIRVCISPVADLGSLGAGTGDAKFACHEVKVPALWTADKYITYAAKAHPEFLETMLDSSYSKASGISDERKHSPIVVTFVANPTRGPAELLLPENRPAYSPHFFLV